MKGLGKREILEETRRPAASPGTIPTCENPGATPPGNRTPFTWVGGDSVYSATNYSDIALIVSTASGNPDNLSQEIEREGANPDPQVPRLLIRLKNCASAKNHVTGTETALPTTLYSCLRLGIGSKDQTLLVKHTPGTITQAYGCDICSENLNAWRSWLLKRLSYVLNMPSLMSRHGQSHEVMSREASGLEPTIISMSCRTTIRIRHTLRDYGFFEVIRVRPSHIVYYTAAHTLPSQTPVLPSSAEMMKKMPQCALYLLTQPEEEDYDEEKYEEEVETTIKNLGGVTSMPQGTQLQDGAGDPQCDGPARSKQQRHMAPLCIKHAFAGILARPRDEETTLDSPRKYKGWTCLFYVMRGHLATILFLQGRFYECSLSRVALATHNTDSVRPPSLANSLGQSGTTIPEQAPFVTQSGAERSPRVSGATLSAVRPTTVEGCVVEETGGEHDDQVKPISYYGGRHDLTKEDTSSGPAHVFRDTRAVGLVVISPSQPPRYKRSTCESWANDLPELGQPPYSESRRQIRGQETFSQGEVRKDEGGGRSKVREEIWTALIIEVLRADEDD
ncbi:hypothetical protein PR048_016890 [Dryococelus australis]|uniref:Uncharacterized protein n=1 Tax=Dryococelus australis TaxID=614101 RepID=A0ABQ9H831_9NEOP|nr:hypothetical protein PR048_016890 [Dryococelus australis]